MTIAAPPPAATKTITMAAALNRALADSLAADARVVVFGADVGTLGGVFRVTDGLAARFGNRRVFDTPVAESGIVGTAIGMAMNGLVPVIEMQFDAFAYPAFEQVTSHLAKMRNRTRGRVALPVVIRVPYGGGIGGLEHHSDSSESYYVHTPGLRVVAPSTPSDAYRLLRQSISCPDPVVFLEPKRRYWAKEAAQLSDDGSDTTSPDIGQAVIRRPGTDVTLIAYGAMVATALEAAEAATDEGWDVEVIDLRSLSPLDDATLAGSVRRTGRAVVVHEAQGFGGYGGEVAARLTEQCFYHLEAPVLRVTGLDIPYPPPNLEHLHLPTVDRILDAVARLEWEGPAKLCRHRNSSFTPLVPINSNVEPISWVRATVLQVPAAAHQEAGGRSERLPGGHPPAVQRRAGGKARGVEEGPSPDPSGGYEPNGAAAK
jgi:2-oxoisovalerate dehydrogenase E1 component beta subunit